MPAVVILPFEGGVMVRRYGPFPLVGLNVALQVLSDVIVVVPPGQPIHESNVKPDAAWACRVTTVPLA
jgi:hypothetical protein